MSSDLKEAYKKAFKKISETDKVLPPDVLLRLYAYNKQVTSGDNFITSQQNLNVRDAFKFNAWIQLKGMKEEEAMKEYIHLAEKILKH